MAASPRPLRSLRRLIPALVAAALALGASACLPASNTNSSGPGHAIPSNSSNTHD